VLYKNSELSLGREKELKDPLCWREREREREREIERERTL